MFINMHKRVEFDRNWLKAMGVDDFLTLKMSVESFSLPEDLSSAIKKMILSFTGITQDNDPVPEATKNLVNALQKHNTLLNQFIDIKTIT